MSVQKPAVLLAHGSWHVPAHYQDFLNLLNARGYKTVAPTLPSCRGRPFPDSPPEADIAAIREAATALVNEGHEIIAIGHSHGGLVVTEALSGLGVKERKANGQRGGVRWLLYVAAFLLGEGRTCEMDAPVEAVQFCRYEGDEKVMSPGFDMGDIMYPDLPIEQRERWLSMTVPNPKASSFYQLKQFAYREIDAAFVFCELDTAFPYPAQKATVEGFASEGILFETENLPSGHFPSLSIPDKLADIVDKYATKE